MLRYFIEMIISFEFAFDYLGSVPKPTKLPLLSATCILSGTEGFHK